MLLTPGEIEVMNVLWARGPSTVQEVSDCIDRRLSYSTVMSVLRNLYYKRQALNRIKQNRAYVYEPIVQRDDVCRDMIDSLKRTLAGGSVKRLLVTLLEGETFSAADVAEMRDAIDRAESRSTLQ